MFYGLEQWWPKPTRYVYVPNISVNVPTRSLYLPTRSMYVPTRSAYVVGLSPTNFLSSAEMDIRTILDDEEVLNVDIKDIVKNNDNDIVRKSDNDIERNSEEGPPGNSDSLEREYRRYSEQPSTLKRKTQRCGESDDAEYSGSESTSAYTENNADMYTENNDDM